MSLTEIYLKILQDYRSGEKVKQDRQYCSFILYRHLSFPIAALLISRGISANQTTVLGFVLMLVSFLLLMLTEHIYAGCGIYFLAVLLDYADGTIARFIKKPNYFGKLIDGLVDYFSFYIFAAVGLANLMINDPIISHEIDLVVAIGTSVVSHALLYFRMRVAYFISEINAVKGDDKLTADDSTQNQPAGWFARLNLIVSNVMVLAPILLIASAVFDMYALFVLFYFSFYITVFVAELVLRLRKLYKLSSYERAL